MPRALQKEVSIYSFISQGIAASICTSFNWLVSFAVTYVVPALINTTIFIIPVLIVINITIIIILVMVIIIITIFIILVMIMMIIRYVVPPLGDAINPSSCYFIFAGIALAGTIFVLLVVPETKGKSEEDIRKLFK